MNDPNRLMKWLLVIVLVALSLAVLYPPKERLKGGIDLVGGTSLLFEIDTTGLDPDQQRDLSTRVMRILKDRVDPQGQMNLEWRPVGSTRLEVRMPRPPKEALERREAFNRSLEALQAKNLKRREVEEALNVSDPQERSAKLAALERGVPERKALIERLAAAHEKYRAAQTGLDASVKEAASAEYEKAMSDLLATSLPVTRLTDILALPKGEKRDEQLEKIRKEFPAYDAGEDAVLSRVVRAYDAWAKNKAELEDPSDLKRRLRGAGVLEFRILADRSPISPGQIDGHGNPQLEAPIAKYVEQLAKHGPKPRPGDRYQWFPVHDVLKFMHLDSMEDFEKRKNLPGTPIVEEYAGKYYVLMHRDPEFAMTQGQGKGWSLKSAHPDRDPMTGENVVSFVLDARGGRLFGELTGANIGRQLCILLDGEASSHATIKTQIHERCQISGRFTAEQVNDLVRTLEAGSLPARLKEIPLREQTVGPSLGETNRHNGLRASVSGLILVGVFMIFYYGLVGGGTTNIALCLNLLFTIAIMATMQATFTLPGIAGLLLSIGMAIDANVLIFERIREERARGVPFKKALSLGYDKAFSAILDGNVTTIITCIILGMVGSEEIKGFAITLGIGIAISMFTALTVTRLIYNELVRRGWLNDFSMRKLIGVPKIDWIALRRVFWPLSMAMVIGGMGLFLWMSTGERKNSFYDIEFLGGTSMQVDLKPGIVMDDQAIRELITSDTSEHSAVKWLRNAAESLKQAKISEGEQPGQFVVSEANLNGEQLAVLIRKPIDDKLERDGTRVEGNQVTFITKPGVLSLEGFRTSVQTAAEQVADAAHRLRTARIQSVGDAARGDAGKGLSYEIVTVETNRPVVQEAVLAVLGDKLSVQRAIRYALVRDEAMTREPYFYVEQSDENLAEVVGGDATFNVRPFRGGVAAKVRLDLAEEPISTEEFRRRMREVGLQPEFEHTRAREVEIFALDSGVKAPDGTTLHKEFAVLAVDDSFSRDDDEVAWTEGLAKSHLAQIDAALGSEKSLSKVVQFAPQIAGQTTSRAIFATVLAALGIGAYVGFRFGTREFGLAVLVTVVHDVCVVLGAIALTHFIYDNPLGRLLMIEDTRFDLTVLAGVLTIIGYQLNDTIVVFDRIRENRGKSGALSEGLINESINQTMSRTILTATLVTLTVIVLYVFGGSGIHGFAYVMLVGTLAGTYSTVAVAVPLVYAPRLLVSITTILAAIGLIGLTLLVTSDTVARLIISGLILAGTAFVLTRSGAQRFGRAREAVGV